MEFEKGDITKSAKELLNFENPSEYLYKYALDNGRLSPEWERLLLEYKDVWYIMWYTRGVIKGRWFEAEPILLELKDAFWIMWYARDVIKGRWPEAEPILLESKDIYGLYWYARYVIKGKWLEAESIIRQDKLWCQEYCEHFNIKEEK